MKPSVAFYTLGCKLNFSESSAISRQFVDAGFSVTDFGLGADVYVINTCSVTDHADRKCKKVVREAKKNQPTSKVLIIGCYAQLKPEEILTIPGVDAVFGASEKFQIPALLKDINEEKRLFNRPIKEVKTFHTAFSKGERTRSFLKVQDGCNYFCSFCTIPLARGRSRSDTIENVLLAANDLAQEGVREIVLTGVNIGDFGYPNQERFIDLANALEAETKIDRLRISSIEPNLLKDEVIDLVAASEKFVPHFHIPLQSGSDKILKSMRRRYERKLYKDRIERIKHLMPDCCIGVDVIVGYPGETEEDYMATYQFLNELDISYLHVFSYSERPNTTSVRMEGRVPNQVRTERRKKLQILSEKKKRAFYESQIGQVRKVLFEEKQKDGFIYGHTDNYLSVKAPYDPVLVNEVIPFKLNSLDEDGHFIGYEFHPAIRVG